MARVKSYFRLRGSLGESTFVKQKTANGYLVQDKLETTPGNFKTNPKLARVRENSNDFGTAARGGKLIRNSVSSLIADARCLFRLILSLISSILKVFLDLVSDHPSTVRNGNVRDGNLTLLARFASNANASMESQRKAIFIYGINCVQGSLLTLKCFKEDVLLYRKCM